MRNLVTFFLSIFSVYNSGSIYEYKYPNNSFDYSNYGTIGIIQNPSARLLPEGSLALNWIHYDPYLRGSLIAYPFDWFEASFQYTDINNALYSDVAEFSGSQSLKDKSFDAKFRLIKETNILPQVSIGFRDLGGTGLFSSEYVVASKFLKENIDFTIGIGWGNLNGNQISNPLKHISSRFEERVYEVGKGGEFNVDSFFSGDAGIFSGIEYLVPGKKLKLKIEYDGTNYQTESRFPLDQGSKFNYGFSYGVSKDLKIKLFYTRGNTINFGFSHKFDFGARNPTKISKTPRPNVQNSEAIKKVTSREVNNLYRASLLYLRNNDFNLQKANLNNDSQLEIVYSQSNYKYPLQSAGRALEILDKISPDTINSFKISEVNGGLGVYELEIHRDDLKRYSNFQSPESAFKSTIIKPFKFKEEGYSFDPKTSYPAVFNSIAPELLSQIGGPDGFFFGDLKIKLDTEILFKRNLSLLSVLNYGLVNNFDDLKLGSDSVLPHVRTDIVDYLKQSTGLSVTRMQLNYYQQYGNDKYLKIAGGIFESMFAGYGFEGLYRPFYKNYGIGIEMWRAYQREYDQLFETRKYNTYTGHLNLYYEEPKTNILFHIKAGKYLAGDSGFTFDFSRVFKSNFRVGAYFSLTDISKEEFGEGSFDKGFYFWIPLDIFSSTYTRRNFGWGLRPVTRDGAQFLIHGYPLWGVTDMSNIYRFKDNVPVFFD